LPEEGHVVVVGALVPILKRLKVRGKPFGILELDLHTLKSDKLPYAIPEDKADAEIRRADMLIITGTTLLNNSLEPLLACARPGASIVVVGPTASMLPGAFFRVEETYNHRSSEDSARGDGHEVRLFFPVQ